VPKRPGRTANYPKERAERPRTIPRGSSNHLPPVPSLSVRSLALQPALAIYRPPPINSVRDRVTHCPHSFPLNAGLGNNRTNRDL